MKLSEIITKYEPLGWKFKFETTHIDDFWSYKSPRMIRGHGFPWEIDHNIDPEKTEIDEEKMLRDESKCYVYAVYRDKIDKAFDFVKKDIINQLETLDGKKLDIPDEVKVSFNLVLK